MRRVRRSKCEVVSAKSSVRSHQSVECAVASPKSPVRRVHRSKCEVVSAKSSVRRVHRSKCEVVSAKSSVRRVHRSKCEVVSAKSSVRRVHRFMFGKPKYETVHSTDFALRTDDFGLASHFALTTSDFPSFHNHLQNIRRMDTRKPRNMQLVELQQLL